jgi:hypothetical protein
LVYEAASYVQRKEQLMYDADDEMNRLHEFMREEAAFNEKQLGLIKKQVTVDEALARLDLEICWECAETRPTFAHQTCQEIDNHLQALKEINH